MLSEDFELNIEQWKIAIAKSRDEENEVEWE